MLLLVFRIKIPINPNITPTLAPVPATTIISSTCEPANDAVSPDPMFAPTPATPSLNPMLTHAPATPTPTCTPSPATPNTTTCTPAPTSPTYIKSYSKSYSC